MYALQVDPVFKILHWPSIHKHLTEGKPYLNYKPQDPAVEALSSAVYYAATSSLTEAQSLSLFAASKVAVIARYRLACETSLARAGLVNTEDMTTLQAYMLFLVSPDCSTS